MSEHAHIVIEGSPEHPAPPLEGSAVQSPPCPRCAALEAEVRRLKALQGARERVRAAREQDPEFDAACRAPLVAEEEERLGNEVARLLVENGRARALLGELAAAASEYFAAAERTAGMIFAGEDPCTEPLERLQALLRRAEAEAGGGEG